MNTRPYSDELTHYGVKGMKWGVRRYQDYNGKLTAAGKERQAKNRRYKKTVDEYAASGKAFTKNLSHYSVGELTTMTTNDGKTFVSGLMSGHDFEWHEVHNVAKDRGDQPEYQNVADVIKRDPNYSRYKDYGLDKYALDAISKGRFTPNQLYDANPDFGSPGTTQNCAKCSAALEVMLRGYDINAGRQTYPSSVDAPSYWFKGAERIDYSSDSADSALRSYGPKTSGMISIQYPTGGGHAMHWTNDADGNFQIQDGQNRSIFSSVEEMMDAYGADKTKPLSTYRLDNCEIDWDHMSSDSVITKRSGYTSESKVQNKFTSKIVDTW